MGYQNPVDIANRALQHCGVQRIADFTEDTLQASETAFAYDKLRRAELRRNVWQFAIRNACIRPITAGSTMFLSPTLWSSTTTYALGAIVSDAMGAPWQSRSQDNLNQSPGNSSAWELYAGPLTADPYDTTGTTGYLSGEMVYETPGDGTYTVYMSLTSNNSQDPRSPSNWVATTQYSKDQVVLYYAAWAIGTTYAAGDGVSYNGIYYVSLAAANVGNEPDTATTKWVAVTTTISPPYYSATTAYVIGQFVTYSGLNYVCILATTGNLPTDATYWAAQAVGTTYASLIDFNLNNNPVTATTAWTATNPFGNANTTWLQVAVQLIDIQITYPLGSGPPTQTFTRNIYRLPANFLRKAPQDPKMGSVSYLGAPSGRMYDDWNLQGPYLVTREVYPISLRFVADITDVTTMDDMFCEGLAARIGLEVCERLTQSTSKLAGIAAQYRQFMSDARIVNGIETGPTEPPLDDWIACRI